MLQAGHHRERQLDRPEDQAHDEVLVHRAALPAERAARLLGERGHRLRAEDLVRPRRQQQVHQLDPRDGDLALAPEHRVDELGVGPLPPAVDAVAVGEQVRGVW